MMRISDTEYAVQDSTNALYFLMKTWFTSSKDISNFTVNFPSLLAGIHNSTSTSHRSQISKNTFASDTDKVARSNGASEKGFFQSKAKVAGVFAAVGVVVTAIILASLYFFCSRRCRHGVHLHHEKANELSDSSESASKHDGLPVSNYCLERNQSFSSKDAPVRRKSNWSLLSYFKSSTHGLPGCNNSCKGLNAHEKESLITTDDPIVSPLQEFEQRMAPYSIFDSKDSLQCAGNDYISPGNKLFITNPE